jgi:hypothetical protein
VAFYYETVNQLNDEVNSSDDGGEDGGSMIGLWVSLAIAGAIGGVVVMAVLGLVAFVLVRRYRNKRKGAVDFNSLQESPLSGMDEEE